MARIIQKILKQFATKKMQDLYLIADFPYPIMIQKKGTQNEEVPSDSKGPTTFDEPEYLEINHARLKHLESLKLPIEEKTVLDVGCGVGQLAQFFVDKRCKVVCIDGREQNIASLRSRYRDLTAHVANVEKESLSQYGKFDIVFCYGLLYHLENPVMALRNMASVCNEFLLLETMVCDHRLPLAIFADESAAFSQALKGLGCRPSPSFVVMVLNKLGFRFVYAPKKMPEYKDFAFKWRNTLEWRQGGHPLRCTFIASKIKLDNPQLVSLYE